MVFYEDEGVKRMLIELFLDRDGNQIDTEKFIKIYGMKFLMLRL